MAVSLGIPPSLQSTRVLQARTEVKLLRQALEDSKRELKKGIPRLKRCSAIVFSPLPSEYDLLSRLEHSNSRREERLGRVRGKDLHSKEEIVQVSGIHIL